MVFKVIKVKKQAFYLNYIKNNLNSYLEDKVEYNQSLNKKDE
jgi:hypothetical protein